MMPMIAGPPYAVAPTLRNPIAISLHVLANTSVIELHLRPAAGRPRFLIHGDGRGDVLQRRARAVEDRDLVRPRSPRPSPGDHLAELGVNLLAGHEAGGEHVLELADLG